jgi:hypothetical protein
LPRKQTSSENKLVAAPKISLADCDEIMFFAHTTTAVDAAAAVGALRAGDVLLVGMEQGKAGIEVVAQRAGAVGARQRSVR